MNLLLLFVAAVSIFYLNLISVNAASDDKKDVKSDGNCFSPRWSFPLLSVGEKHYYLGIFFKLNWFRAAQFCRYHGMDLASISSKEENDELIKHIVNQGFQKSRFWTSGTDLGQKGQYFWMSNGQPFTFQEWHAGNPSNSGGNEDCMELLYHDNETKFNDAPCLTEYNFVCEIIW